MKEGNGRYCHGSRGRKGMQLKGDKVSLTEHNLLGLFGGTAQVELLQPHYAEYKPRYLQ